MRGAPGLGPDADDTALARFGGSAARPALRRAAEWATLTQHPDGSWGVWGPTPEETAYGVQILLAAPTTPTEPLARARTSLGHHLPDAPAHPPLWHDKALYTPTAVVEAEVLATLHTLATLP